MIKTRDLVSRLHACAAYFYDTDEKAHEAYYMRRILNDVLEEARPPHISPLAFDDLIDRVLKLFDPYCIKLD